MTACANPAVQAASYRQLQDTETCCSKQVDFMPAAPSLGSTSQPF